MDDLRGNLAPVTQTDLRQVVLQEFGAAADVIAGEFGTIGLLEIAAAAQVADVVKQRQHHAQYATLGAELTAAVHLLFMSCQQSRHRQRDIECVLAVVIDRIDPGVPWHAPGEQGVEIAERALHRGQLHLRPDRHQQLLGGSQYLLRRADAHRVGDVEVAAAVGGLIDAAVRRRAQ